MTRFIMKLIAKSAGAPVDTSRDYEFTDWNKLDLLVEELIQSTSTEARQQSSADSGTA